MRSFFFPIAVSFAALAPALSSAAPPQRIEIAYELTRNGSAVAEVTDRLEHDGRSYRLSETWKGKGVFGLRGEAVGSSQGAIVADGLRPLKFEDKRPGRDTQQAEFDPAAKTPTLQRQDRLSFIWTFAFAQPKGAVSISVNDGKQTKSYTYEPAGREKVKTPAGEFDALKFVKRRDKPEDKVTEIWFAADRNFVPVRMLIVDKDGTRVDQVATKITTQ